MKMEAIKYSISDVSQSESNVLNYLDIPIRESNKLLNDSNNNYDRAHEIFYSSSKSYTWLSKNMGMEANKNHQPIPLNKIGLLSEHFKNMNKNKIHSAFTFCNH